VWESFENKHEFGRKAFPRKLSKWQGSTLRKSLLFRALSEDSAMSRPTFRCCLLFLGFPCFSTHFHPPTHFSEKPAFAHLFEAFPLGMLSVRGSKSYLFRWVAHSNVWASVSRLKKLQTVGESFENKHEFGRKAFPRKLSKWQGSTLRKSWVFEPLAKIRQRRVLLFVVACCFLVFLVFNPLPPSNPLLRQTCFCSPFRSVPAWYAEFLGLENALFSLGSLIRRFGHLFEG